MQDFARHERQSWLGLWQFRRKPMAAWLTDVHASPAPDIQPNPIMHIRRDGLPCVHVQPSSKN
jgi:hypothetical protein